MKGGLAMAQAAASRFMRGVADTTEAGLKAAKDAAGAAGTKIRNVVNEVTSPAPRPRKKTVNRAMDYMEEKTEKAKKPPEDDEEEE